LSLVDIGKHKTIYYNTFARNGNDTDIVRDRIAIGDLKEDFISGNLEYIDLLIKTDISKDLIKPSSWKKRFLPHSRNDKYTSKALIISGLRPMPRFPFLLAQETEPKEWHPVKIS